MALRPTASLCSKASRIPLTSKQGGKDFYKGTGSLPGFGPKRQGRHAIRSKSPYLLMAERMRTFVVPSIETDCQLKPFVMRQTNDVPPDWPRAHTKPKRHANSRRNGLYGPKGFDGHYYLQLAAHKSVLGNLKPQESNSVKDRVSRGWDKLNEFFEGKKA